VREEESERLSVACRILARFTPADHAAMRLPRTFTEAHDGARPLEAPSHRDSAKDPVSQDQIETRSLILEAHEDDAEQAYRVESNRKVMQFLAAIRAPKETVLTRISSAVRVASRVTGRVPKR